MRPSASTCSARSAAFSACTSPESLSDTLAPGIAAKNCAFACADAPGIAATKCSRAKAKLQRCITPAKCEARAVLLRRGASALLRGGAEYCGMTGRQRDSTSRSRTPSRTSASASTPPRHGAERVAAQVASGARHGRPSVATVMRTACQPCACASCSKTSRATWVLADTLAWYYKVLQGVCGKAHRSCSWRWRSSASRARASCAKLQHAHARSGSRSSSMPEVDGPAPRSACRDAEQPRLPSRLL